MKKFKIFMSFLKERDWLENMAKKGYILKDITFGMIYEFDETEPADMVYELEKFAVNASGEAGKHELTARKTALDIAAQSGWKVITHDEMMNYYFVKEKSGDESDEFYNDEESRRYRAEKFSRGIRVDSPKMLLSLLMIIAAIYFVLFLLIGNDTKSLITFMWIFFAAAIIEVAVSLYSMIGGEQLYQDMLLSREQWDMQKKFSTKKNFKKVRDLLNYLQDRNEKGAALTGTQNGKYMFEESDVNYVYFADTKKAFKKRLKFRGETFVEEKKDWEKTSTGWYEESISEAESMGIETVCAINGGTIIYRKEAGKESADWDTLALKTGYGDMISSLTISVSIMFGFAFVIGFCAAIFF